ncbi:fasciclin domain-containing protein [uncultured Croceitalea sp.]|uniref:fasciclin domain-containing protein n=1 Tax=uncultured Croceitalea sp. TaxID=1798908 RepID=UPI00374F4FEF
MKIPQIVTCLVVVLLSFNFATAQNNKLTIISSGVYKENNNTDIEKAIDTDNHKTLLAAYKATDLKDMLNESGPFTIFAPSDNAFSKFSKSRFQSMLNSDDKNQLKAVLKYHIVPGKLTASKILKALCRGKGKTTFTTIQGDKITATMRGLDIILTDNMGNSAKITVADTTQGNGVMHEIDSVILPTRI